MILVGGLSSRVEAKDGAAGTGRLTRARRPVVILAGLFGLDSFAGGFIVQSFLVFWFTEHFGATTGLMGVVLAATGIIQAASFVVAPRIAVRWGLLNTMVSTHLPSNLILALIPLAPNLGVALALLLFRFPLSQMDVPARQAYLAALAGPNERAAAASITNAARTVARPFAAPLAGVAVGSPIPGLPFFVAGALKSIYDVVLFPWFRRIPHRYRASSTSLTAATRSPSTTIERAISFTGRPCFTSRPSYLFLRFCSCAQAWSGWGEIEEPEALGSAPFASRSKGFAGAQGVWHQRGSKANRAMRAPQC